MSIFAISDLHLAQSINKPMDVFGNRWSNYMERIKKSWEETVAEDDHVIIPGDISWATYLEQADNDFQFIDDLPGTKYISKGNHDYWWTTHNKLEKYINSRNYSTIRFMHNNNFTFGNILLCGTRGWSCPGDDNYGPEDRKIYERELQRLELSLRSSGSGNGIAVIAALHFPPFNARREPTGFVHIMEKYNVKICIYGHLHGESHKNAVEGYINGIEYRLVSADYLNFKPLKLEF